MELLAPAGSFEAFKAALEEGADAIYIGAPQLNARALSRDFSYQEIDGLVHEAHKRDVKVYIAMNSLVKEGEIPMAVEGLACLEEIGPDALIIQDLGLFELARKYFAGLNLHASTLMSVHNSLAVEKLIELGFKRVVLPRELTLEEIKTIHKKTRAELEVFVHGAMCFSYSGLCLFSSMYGGKSSLRGQCVQPCRRRYGWQKKKGQVRKGKLSEKEGGYLFSMHDLSGIKLLPQLEAAGVSCLKIEGRLKSAEYVRKTVRAYRLLLDDKSEKGPSKARKREAQSYLNEAMGRRWSTGFFISPRPEEAVTPNLSGNIGLPVGRILKLDAKSGRGETEQILLSVELFLNIRVGERLRLHDDSTGERKGFTLRKMQKGNRFVKEAGAGQKVQISLSGKKLRVAKGSFKGGLFKVDVSSGRAEEQKARAALVKKHKRVLQPDERKIQRILEACLPVEMKKEDYRVRSRRKGRLPVWLKIQSLRDRQHRLPVSPERYIVPLDSNNIMLLLSAPQKLRRLDQEIVWALPPVILEEELDWYQQTVSRLIDEGFAEYQLGHFTQTRFFEGLSVVDRELKLFGSYTINVLNSMAMRFIRGIPFSGFQFSLETDEENLGSAMQHFRSSTIPFSGSEQISAVGMFVYGNPPLFSARLDDARYQYGKRFVSPKGEVFVLERDGGMTYARSVIPFSLLDMQKELAQLGIEYFVVDLSFGNMVKNIQKFSGVIKGRRREANVLAGNFKSGLL